jgi:uncharacterized protein
MKSSSQPIMGQDSPVPQIWFDQSPSETNNGDCNCDCACPTPHPNLPYRFQGNHLLVGESVFRKTISLHDQKLDGEYRLVCNPVGTGYSAVLDSSASAVLDCFESATSLAQVRQAFPDLRSEVVDQTAAQLLQLGLLEDPHHSVSSHSWSEPQTLTAWLHITNECNLRCPYCYLHKTPDEMSEDVALQTVDAVFRSAVLHGFQQVKLKYAGGEASLNFRHVLAVHDYASRLAEQLKLGLEAVMLSNAVAISGRMIEELAQRNIRVMISLDGVGEYHDAQRVFANGKGSFFHVDRSITRLLEHGMAPDISITVTERNLDGLPALMEYVLSRHLPFSLNYYRENECSASVEDLRYGEARMIEAMRAAFDVIEHNLPRRSLLGCLVDRANLSAPHQHTCGVGRNYIVIDQHGGVAKCQMDIRNTLTTIREEDVLHVVRNDRAGIQNLPVEEKEGCKSCEWRYWCTGGCPLLTHRATGRYDVRSPNCSIYKTLYPEVLRLEGLRLLKYESPWMPREGLQVV